MFSGKGVDSGVAGNSSGPAALRDDLIVVVGRRSSVVGLSFDNSIIVLSININQFYTVGAGASPLNPHQVRQTDYGP